MSDEIELIPGLKINETIEEPAKKDNEAPEVQKIDYSQRLLLSNELNFLHISEN